MRIEVTEIQKFAKRNYDSFAWVHLKVNCWFSMLYIKQQG